jgi:hypothetical protein
MGVSVQRHAPAEIYPRGKDPGNGTHYTGGWMGHPASCIMGTVTGVLSPGVKRGRGVTLNTHPHLVPRLRMSRSYTSSHPIRLHGV